MFDTSKAIRVGQVWLHSELPSDLKKRVGWTRLTDASTAWEQLMHDYSPIAMEELIRTHASNWGLLPMISKAYTNVFTVMLEVLINCRIVSSPRFATASASVNGDIALPERQLVRLDYERSLVESVRPHSGKQLWSFTPGVMARSLLPNSGYRMIYGESDSNIADSYRDAHYYIAPGCYNPLFMMAILMHECWHLCLDDPQIGVQLQLALPEEKRELVANLANWAMDGRVHALLNLTHALDIWAKLIDYPPDPQTKQALAEAVRSRTEGKRGGPCAGGSKSDLGSGAGPADPLDAGSFESDEPDNKNGAGRSFDRLTSDHELGDDDPEIKVINEGSGRASYAAKAQRQAIAQAVLNEIKNEKSIGSEAMLAQVRSKWESELREDPLQAALSKLKAALDSAVSHLYYDQGENPDPTDAYLIRKGLVARELADRDDETVTIRCFAVIDSSGSMSRDDIEACIGSARSALGGQALMDLVFCDTEPMKVADSVLASDLLSYLNRLDQIPRGGTSLGAAIRQYEQMFKRSLSECSVVLMLTDGYNSDWAIEELNKSRIPIVVGLVYEDDPTRAIEYASNLKREYPNSYIVSIPHKQL